LLENGGQCCRNKSRRYLFTGPEERKNDHFNEDVLMVSRREAMIRRFECDIII
jgi:hypothetical protein